MSALCHCPYFRENVAGVHALREHTEIEGVPVVTYNGTNHYVRNAHLIGLALCHDVVGKVLSQVQKESSTSHSSQVCSGVDLFAISSQVCANWCDVGGIDPRRIELQRSLEMDQEEFQSTVEKTSQMIQLFFAVQIYANNVTPDSSGCLCIQKPNALVFHASKLPDQLDIWQGEIFAKCTNYLFEQLGFTSMGEAVFSEKQKQRFEVHSSKIETCPNKLSCFAYALLQVGELQAKSLIFFDRSGNQANRAILATRKTLSSWGWRVVEMPNEGDLVLYYSPENETCTHVGVYTEDGKVLSKLGIKNPTIYKHGLFDIDMSGLDLQENKVFFMRKSSGERFWE